MPADGALTVLSQSFDNLRKSDLEVALDEHMRANRARLAKLPDLVPFYLRIAPTTSPVKREVVAIDPSGEKPGDLGQGVLRASETTWTRRRYSTGAFISEPVS
jgi:hypothetical protein